MRIASALLDRFTAWQSALRAVRRLCATAACLTVASLLIAPVASAEEAQTHVFDATLSLTGNCETSSKDPVPDPSCPEETPQGAFVEPFGAAIDSYGDIYYYGDPYQRSPTYVYIFDSSGHFLTQIPLYPALEGVGTAAVRAVAVDSEGDVYLAASTRLYVLTPTRYEPQSGTIEYTSPPEEVAGGSLKLAGAIAIDRTTGRILAVSESGGTTEIAEVGSHAEGNGLLRTFGAGAVPYERNANIAVDATAERIYLSEKLPSKNGAYPSGVRVLDLQGHLLETLTGVETPEGFHEFSAPFGHLGVAVDESTGHLFIDDTENNPKPAVYELKATRETVSILAHSFQQTNDGSAITVDNGAHSPNSAMSPTSPIAEEENPNGSYLFVPSGVSGTGHLYAFAPKPAPKSPAVADESFSGVSNTEAVLAATVSPNGLPAGYRFEYLTAEAFERSVSEKGPEHGFENATVAGTGMLATGNEPVAVSVALDALAPGTAYRFRVVAENACEGEGAPECEAAGEAAAFSTYPVPLLASGLCPNHALRIGFSSALPDCRAYELVTPANTNGHAPRAPDGNSAGPQFGTPPASANGLAVGFLTIGGALPGYPGAGGFNGDPYVATRSSAGWQTASVGPFGTLSTNPVPGGLSPDLRYVAVASGPEDAGSLALADGTEYVRSPDGTYHLVGEGSLATDLQAGPLLISAGGTHVVFRTGAISDKEVLQLVPDAPPSGTAAIYDRTPDGVVHVISLLPGDVTPAAGEDAQYLGASSDGGAVAFKVGSGASIESSPLYVRLGDSETLEVAGANATFEGLSEDGRYAFYLAGGDLYRYDTESEASVRITESGDVTVVNVPSTGTAAYFVSPSVLGEAGHSNPNGAEPAAGEANLYLWDGSGIHFVATLTERDMEGEFTGGGGGTRDALGSWAVDLHGGESARDPSRTTRGGAAIVFESGADLSGYRSGGASEIYRYDAAEGTLACLSCDPTQAPPTGDARLQTVNFSGVGAPTNAFSQIPNLSADGDRVFFESPDALVPADTDGVRDVYEWEADGKGSCATAGGCVFLVSSGLSARASYLYGASESGNDVFLYTTDLLSSEDGSETPSVYDARVDGGLPPAGSRAAECLGEACQPGGATLSAPTLASFAFHGPGNPKPKTTKSRCRKPKRSTGRRKAKRRKRRRARHGRHRARSGKHKRRKARECRRRRRRRHAGGRIHRRAGTARRHAR